jgi:hypothetical protein
MSLMDGYKGSSAESGTHSAGIDASETRLNRLPQRHLPFAFGTIVYHKVRSAKLRGMVTSYMFGPESYAVGVTWDHGLTEQFHRPFELTETFIGDDSDEDEDCIEIEDGDD